MVEESYMGPINTAPKRIGVPANVRFTPEADIADHRRDVRFVPKADI